jgi:hypothetical protein
VTRIALMALLLLIACGTEPSSQPTGPPPPPPLPPPGYSSTALELSFAAAPPDQMAGQMFYPGVEVRVLLPNGSIFPFSPDVTISLESDGQTAALTGKTTVLAYQGVARFTDLA